MNDLIRDFGWLCERIILKYAQIEKLPQKYCGNLVHSQSEIHIIVIIGDQPGIGITQLAKMRGITKGAVSQMIYKLVAKELVIKKVSPDSDAAVNLFLTEKGEQVRTEHRKMHETRSEMFQKLMSSIPEENLLSMTEFLKELEKELNKEIEKI